MACTVFKQALVAVQGRKDKVDCGYLPYLKVWTTGHLARECSGAGKMPGHAGWSDIRAAAAETGAGQHRATVLKLPSGWPCRSQISDQGCNVLSR